MHLISIITTRRARLPGQYNLWSGTMERRRYILVNTALSQMGMVFGLSLFAIFDNYFRPTHCHTVQPLPLAPVKASGTGGWLVVSVYLHIHRAATAYIIAAIA